MVIPEEMRDRLMNLLYQEHSGTSHMEMLARSFVWWSGIDLAVKQHVARCKICQAVQPDAQPIPLHP